jgi:hypothetical protein
MHHVFPFISIKSTSSLNNQWTIPWRVSFLIHFFRSLLQSLVSIHFIQPSVIRVSPSCIYVIRAGRSHLCIVQMSAGKVHKISFHWVTLETSRTQVPHALCSLSVASYDSQGYGGGILSRLHTGAAVFEVDAPVSFVFNTHFILVKVIPKVTLSATSHSSTFLPWQYVQFSTYY